VRQGARIAVDVGSVRIGVAACDPSAVLTSPVTVLPRDPKRGSDLAALVELAATREAIEVVVGWPRSLSGGEGPAARTARDFARRLAAAVAPRPVRLVDERLSTVEAAGRLRRAGRDARSARPVIDAEAAAVILESALDAERRTGRPPGELVAAAAQEGS
jgi:putative Holliday junction resolvase